ncbi:hypothetical protein MESS2_1030002 [Mesorhizobium metallidurans STM 2683]|uniref:Uncharacterized protein n=1 Tax=Mesorhizobium metallidurans STM 2683 TaxID=1297569 RepID=M5EFS8_9HYPH|nr:hypothetical protein MESS2_1030002 [Mesorhizobium metallidurans STM 2683]
MRPGLLQLVSLDVAGVDHQRLVVRLVDLIRRQQDRGNDLDVVVVGRGVEAVRLAAREHLVDEFDGSLGQFAGVLEHGRILLAGDDRLDRSGFGVLAGHHGPWLVGGAVADSAQRGDDAARQAVIGRKHAVDAAAVRVIGGEQVVHAGLGGRGQPAQRADLVHAHLAGLHDQRLVVDKRLQHRHSAVVEEEGVVVVRRTAEQLDVERTLLLRIAEALEQRFGLDDADAEIVEGGIVVDIGRLLDQAVISDDDDTGVSGLLQRVRHGGAVDRGDDQRLRALGDFVFQLAELVRNVVLRVLQVDRVAERLELGLDGVAVIDPALRGLGRHQHADQAFACLRRQRHGRDAKGRDGGQCLDDFHSNSPWLMDATPRGFAGRAVEQKRKRRCRLSISGILPIGPGTLVSIDTIFLVIDRHVSGRAEGVSL